MLLPILMPAALPRQSRRDHHGSHSEAQRAKTLTRAAVSLLRRQDGPNEGEGGLSRATIVVIAVISTFVLLFSIGIGFRLYRNKRLRDKYGKGSSKGTYHQTGSVSSLEPRRMQTVHVHSNFDASRRETHTRNLDASVDPNRRNPNRNTTDSAVDRNTSVRSIMTLPAYSHDPNATEQVLAREGERDGVDMIIVHHSDQDAAQIDSEVNQSAYRISLANRQEQAERQERRRQLNEARERGDIAAVVELERRRRAASAASAVSELREEHHRIRDRRSRAVSVVSYGDLGVASHDGTRLRANSTESERVGLLSDAASMSQEAQTPRTPLSSHHRERSSSSVLSYDSEAMPSPGLPRSGATTPRLSASRNRAGSSPEMIGEEDLAEVDLEAPSPPGYDEVSLNDARSGAATPILNEPPPNYPGRSDIDLVERVAHNGDLSEAPTSNSTSGLGLDGVPQLPSITISPLPEIVIERSNSSRDSGR